MIITVPVIVRVRIIERVIGTTIVRLRITVIVKAKAIVTSSKS